jgi:hypothetical protein
MIVDVFFNFLIWKNKTLAKPNFKMSDYKISQSAACDSNMSDKSQCCIGVSRKSDLWVHKDCEHLRGAADKKQPLTHTKGEVDMPTAT